MEGAGWEGMNGALPRFVDLQISVHCTVVVPTYCSLLCCTAPQSGPTRMGWDWLRFLCR